MSSQPIRKGATGKSLCEGIALASRRHRVSFVFGTRPEAIKLSPVILAMRGDPRFVCTVCVTAQHRQMLDQVLVAFEIQPDKDLDLMQPDQTLAAFTGRAVGAIDDYLSKERPDLLLVQGDTTTVFCAALAAFYQHIPVGHVEAGLRTGNLQAPWPEEANRVLTSKLATLHFAPTESSKKNLLEEKVPSRSIVVSGNTVIDALLIALEKITRHPPTIPGLPAMLQAGIAFDGPPLVLITGHRRESYGVGFQNVCEAIAKLAERFPQTHFVYPVHLNPNVREPVSRILGVPGSPPRATPNIHLIEPLGYLPFVALMNRSRLIVTDSGGIQEEAPSLGRPVLITRDSTERPEAVEAGTARLVGTNPLRIVEEVSRLLTDQEAYRDMSRRVNPYGDGRSAQRIRESCAEYLASMRPS